MAIPNYIIPIKKEKKKKNNIFLHDSGINIHIISYLLTKKEKKGKNLFCFVCIILLLIYMCLCLVIKMNCMYTWWVDCSKCLLPTWLTCLDTSFFVKNIVCNDIWHFFPILQDCRDHACCGFYSLVQLPVHVCNDIICK